MNAPEDLATAERRNDARYLPPVAKAHDIAVGPAAVCKRHCMANRTLSETVDEVMCVGKRRPAADEGSAHSSPSYRAVVSRWRTKTVNFMLTIFAVEQSQAVWHGAPT